MSRRPSPAAVLTLAALAVGLTLGGCGKKPSHVDPPQGRENDHFPRTYPAPQGVDKNKTPSAPEKKEDRGIFGGPSSVGVPGQGDDAAYPFPSPGGLRFP